jgi:hypothetical protein
VSRVNASPALHTPARWSSEPTRGQSRLAIITARVRVPAPSCCMESFVDRGTLASCSGPETVNFILSDVWHRAVVKPAAAIRHELQKLRPLASYDTPSGPCHGNSSHRSRMFVVGVVCSMIVRGQVLIISRPERASRLAMSIKAPIDGVNQVDRRS